MRPVAPNIVHLKKCRRCGRPAREAELVNDAGEVVLTFDACPACLRQTNVELARVRPIFDAMITAGVDRDTANEAMSFLLDRLEEKKKG